MTTAAPPRAEPAAPAATRSRRPGWRSPRLLLGVLLVAGSVVAGARLVAAADDTVGVWSVVRDLPEGAKVSSGDLEARQVRFPDERTADGYLAAADAVPEGVALDRPVTAGELLPRAALAQDPGEDLVEVPVSVLTDDLPATVRQGSVVDVWVAPQQPGDARARARAVPLLTDVVVVDVPRTSDGLAPQTTRQVIVGVPADRSADLGVALGGMAEGRVVIARKG